MAIFDQGRAGLKHERLHLVFISLSHLGDLGVIEGADLREDERGLLALGKVVEVCEQLTELGTLLDLFGKSAVGSRSTSSTGVSRRARSIVRHQLRAMA